MSKKQLNIWFWLIVCFHLFLWTVLPTLTRYALPMDANEGYLWGSVLEFGYDRDPWLNAWLTRFAVELGGRSGWAVYALSQLCVLSAFWSVWRLGRRILPIEYAFVAVFLLEGIQYYHLAVIDFNDNALELGLWPLMILSFHRALRKERLRDWLSCGVLAGLGLMAKYYTLFPLVCMFLFLVVDPKARQCFKTIGVYLGLVVMIVVILPHVEWLYYHDFMTIRYTQDRISTENLYWWDQYYPGFRFILTQLGAFLGGIVVCSPMLLCRASDSSSVHVPEVSAFDRRFLLFHGFGPFILTIVVSWITGWQLNTMWGTPLLSLWGLCLFLWWRPVLNAKRLGIFIGTIFFILSAIGLGYVLSLMKPGTLSSANEPAEEFVEIVERLWFEETEKPLYYVAGDRYLAGYVVYYSSEHPEVLIDGSLLHSNPIDLQRFHEKGAVFLKRVHSQEDAHFDPILLKQFSGLKVFSVQHLAYHRSILGKPSLDVLIGILPPAKQLLEENNAIPDEL